MARVLIIAYTTYAHDGRVKRHAEALAERGDQVDVVCLQGPGCGQSNGINVIGLRIPRYRGSSRTHYLGSYLRFLARAAWAALSRSLADRYDVVIVCTMPDAVVLCAVGPKLLGSKVVLDVHDTMPELYQDKFGGRLGALGARLLMVQERACSSLADRVFAVHELHRQRLERAGVRRDKLKVVMNTPDPRVFFANYPAAQARREEFTLVCHGTVTYRLGLDVVMGALDLLRYRIPAIRLIVIGEGDYLASVREQVARLNLASRVDFEPPLPLERLPVRLRRAALGLVPNRATSATRLMLPVKLLEYAMLGIPVVAARLHTIEHYFGGGAVKFFEPGNPAELADAIEELYQHPEHREELVRRARRVIEWLSWANERKRYCQEIDSLLADRSRPGLSGPNGCRPDDDRGLFSRGREGRDGAEAARPATFIG